MSITSKHRWLICWLYAAGMLGLSIMPAGALTETPELFPQQDKVLHALMYGGWAIMLGWALHKQMQNRPTTWMVGIVLIATAYGVLMEGLQGSLIWIQRACSWGDMLANLAGAILGVGLFALCRRKV
ncbi:MAG: VanZ family protein [Kiritimatiellae bacterium]|nr:VanZ family protein [Kiritimatiellia bacterium]